MLIIDLETALVQSSPPHPLVKDAGIRLALESIGHHDVLRRAEQLTPEFAGLDEDVIGILLDSFHFFSAGQVLDDLDHPAGVDVLAVPISSATTAHASYVGSAS